jgi:hypothetical protein
MDLGTALVAVAAIGAFYSLKSQRGGIGPMGRLRREHRHGSELQPEPAKPSPRELELQREVEDLRERIHVLERIATDERRPRQLAAEIDSLRDS